MIGQRIAAMPVAAAFVIGFGLGAWFGSERAVRRIRFFSDPENRKRFVQAKKKRLANS